MGTYAKGNIRRNRQETLREYLSKQQLAHKVIKTCDELSDKDKKIEPEMVHRMKIAMDGRLKLINKYLPDLKFVEYNDGAEDESREQLEDRLKQLLSGGSGGNPEPDPADRVH